MSTVGRIQLWDTAHASNTFRRQSACDFSDRAFGFRFWQIRFALFAGSFARTFKHLAAGTKRSSFGFSWTLPSCNEPSSDCDGGGG